MTTFIVSPNKSDEENAVELINTFKCFNMNQTQSMNVILWLKEHPSMCGVVTFNELETLKGFLI